MVCAFVCVRLCVCLRCVCARVCEGPSECVSVWVWVWVWARCRAAPPPDFIRFHPYLLLAHESPDPWIADMNCRARWEL